MMGLGGLQEVRNLFWFRYFVSFQWDVDLHNYGCPTWTIQMWTESSPLRLTKPLEFNFNTSSHGWMRTQTLGSVVSAVTASLLPILSGGGGYTRLEWMEFTFEDSSANEEVLFGLNFTENSCMCENVLLLSEVFVKITLTGRCGPSVGRKTACRWPTRNFKVVG